MSNSSDFSVFVFVDLADEVTKLPEFYVICLFKFFKSLPCLSLKTETIIKKITQPKLPKMKNEVTKICNEPGNNDCNYRIKLDLRTYLVVIFLSAIFFENSKI